MNMPPKNDETELWMAVRAGEKMRTAAPRLGIPLRRMEYLANKWSDKGWYEWGTVCDLGWLTPEGQSDAAGPR